MEPESEIHKITKKLIQANDELLAEIDATQETLAIALKLLKDAKEENDRLIARCEAVFKEHRPLATS